MILSREGPEVRLRGRARAWERDRLRLRRADRSVVERRGGSITITKDSPLRLLGRFGHFLQLGPKVI